MNTQISEKLIALTAGATLILAAVNSAQAAEESWITLSGTVKQVESNQFVLDYGEGTINVGMEDGDQGADSFALIQGDKVRVTGIMDDKLFNSDKIQAHSLYIQDVGTSYHDDSENKQDLLADMNNNAVTLNKVTLRGEVTAVHNNVLTLNAGDQAIEVKTDKLGYNLSESNAGATIRQGDYVSIDGELGSNLFDDKSIQATNIVMVYKK